MKISQLYGIRIESENKKRRGYILGISCVNNTIEGYICCNEDENEYFAGTDGARLVGEKMHVFKTDKEKKTAYRLKLGQAVYTDSGKFLGHLEDYTVKANRLAFAHVGKRKYAFNRLVFGDVVILKGDKYFAEVAAKDMFIGAMCEN